jgi:hypothetical protein
LIEFERGDGDGDGCLGPGGFGDEGPDPGGGFGDVVVDAELDNEPDPDPAARLKPAICQGRPPFGPFLDLNTGDASGEVADSEPRSKLAAFESKLLAFWGRRCFPPCTLDWGLSLLVHDMPDSLPPMDGALLLDTTNGVLGDCKRGLMDGLFGDLECGLIELFMDAGIAPENDARSSGDTFPFCGRLKLLKLLRLPGDPCARRKKPGDNSPEFLLRTRDEGFSTGRGVRGVGTRWSTETKLTLVCAV